MEEIGGKETRDHVADHENEVAQGRKKDRTARSDAKGAVSACKLAWFDDYSELTAKITPTPSKNPCKH